MRFYDKLAMSITLDMTKVENAMFSALFITSSKVRSFTDFELNCKFVITIAE